MQEIRVSIIGKTGVGKSALGNALLQHDTFKSQQKTTSVTSECGSGQRKLQLNGVDTLLKVVDTPGLMDIGNSNKTIAKEIVKCINLLSPGPHLFILVFRIDSRLLPEDIKVLEYFKNTFGELIDKFAVVVFTGKDQLDDRGEEDAMREHHAQLSTFSDVFKHRRFATINNKDTTEGKMRDVERILQLLKTTIQNNGGDFYKNEMYEEAKILFEARIRDEEEDKQKALSENDQLKKDQEAMAQQIKHLQQLEEERIQQEQCWQKEREQLTEEREKLIEDKKNKEIDLDKREMELKQKQKETEILRIQLLERERQSAQWLSSTSRQSYTELASTSTYQHAFRRHEKRIHDGSDDNIVDTINMSSSKKLRYESSRERGKMLQEDEQNIKENFVFLLDNLTDPERLLDRLFGKSVFDTDDMEKIKDVKGKRDMTREILNRLLDSGSNSYQSFIDSLKEEGYKTVVKQLESNLGAIYHRNQLMNIEMCDRRQLMLGGIDEHYHVSHAGIGDRSEIYKDQGEVDVVKVVVKKSNSTVILSKKKPDHQNIQIKEEILSTCRRNVKNIANCVLYETQESVFSHELEDEHDDTVKTNDVNSRPASQVELDLTVDMIDDQKAGKDDVVSPLVIKQEPQDDVVSSLVIKQEPQDETYGVPEPTLLPLISSQDIIYNDDQDNTTLLTPDHHSPNLESCQQSTSQHQNPESGQSSTSSCLDSSHINQRKDDTTPIKTSPVYDDDTTPVKTSPVYDDDKVIRPVDKDTLFKVCERGTLDELKSILSDKTIDINRTAMYDCIRSDIQPVAKLNFLITSGAKLDVKDKYYGNSILHEACRYGCVETVEWLLNTGRVDIESKGWFDETPIIEAIRSDKQPVKKLELLILSGAKLDVKYLFGDSLLHVACEYGCVETVEWLLNTGRVDMESINRCNENPILIAIRSSKQSVEKLKLLIAAGAQLDVRDKFGDSILHEACRYGCVETVELLLNTCRVDIESMNYVDETPIFNAIRSDKQPIKKLELLISSGAKLDGKDRYCHSLLHVACGDGRVETVVWLLSTGRVDIESKDNNDNTPIISALLSSKQSIQKVELLLDKGAKLDHSSSIFHYACQYGSLDCVKYFIDKGFNVEARNDKHESPLMLATQSLQKVELLLDKGAKLDSSPNILHYACQYGSLECVEYFIDKGFNVEAMNNKNECPLMLAICSPTQSLQKVKVVLNAGAKLDSSSNILHYACQYGSLGCVKYFIKKKLLNIESRDDNNRTPLFSCVLTKRTQFKNKIEFLMSMNVNKMVRDMNNLSVLQFARKHARKIRVQYLIEKGFTD
ncbi:hypothetical protein SNE40_005961 [Patella caerulea]|uniref:Uncharacterized protein n=1 Tax=Patella caerulea TaxID=87958 RepID=A0AAN8JZD9_PATCE